MTTSFNHTLLKQGYVPILEQVKDKRRLEMSPPIGLLDFIYDVEHALPNIKVCLDNHNTAWVYNEDSRFAAGKIGFGDFRYRGTGEFNYMVHSDNITNNKYADYSAQYRMKMSKNKDTAIKSAKAFLRNPTVDQVHKTIRDNVRSSMTAVRRAKQEELNAHAATLFGIRHTAPRSDAIAMQEMASLYMNNPDVLSPVARDSMETYNKLCAEYHEVNDTGDLQLVLVNRTNSGYRIYVSERKDTNHSWYGMNTTTLQYDIYTEDTVPVVYRERIAVLNMVPNDTYTPNVGYKYAEGVYYVHPDQR